MKKIILLLTTIFLCSTSNANSCFNSNEMSKLKDIHKASSEFYGRVKFDCKSTNKNAQKICASQEHKLLTEAWMRTHIYDYENATHTELTGKAYKAEYSSLFKSYTAGKLENCSELKSSLIELLTTSHWAN